jgi:PST family polysaccharide transporter
MSQTSIIDNFKAKVRSPVVSNIIWLSFDKVLKLVIGLIVGIWVARYLGPSQWGKLNYISAFVSILTVIAKLGMDGFLTKEILQHPESKNEILGTSFLIRLVLLPVLFVSTLGYFYLQNLETEYYFLLAFLFLNVVITPLDLIDLEFQARLQSKLTIISKNIAYVLGAVVRLGLILSQKSILWFAAVMGIEAVLSYVLLLMFYQRNDNIFNWRFDKSSAVSLLKTGWPFILASMAVILYVRLDQIMIGDMAGDRELGIFSSATKISDIFVFLPMAVSSSFLPSLVAAKKQGEAIFIQKIQFFINWMTRISLALAIGVTLFSDQIISILFGPEFQSAGYVLSVHIWALVPMFLGVATTQYLVIENLQKFSLYRTLLGLVTNVGLNIFLIPKYGALGAAIATTVSQFVAAVFSGVLFKQTRILFKMQMKSVLLFDFKGTR